MLSVPPDVNIMELPTSTLWREASGIVCVVSKKAEAQTLEQAKASMEAFRRIFGEEKACLLIDVTHTAERSRELRAYTAEELPKLVKAMAVLSGSALGKMLANLFFNLKSQPYPVKMFNDENEAREWLKKYL